MTLKLIEGDSQTTARRDMIDALSYEELVEVLASPIPLEQAIEAKFGVGKPLLSLIRGGKDNPDTRVAC